MLKSKHIISDQISPKKALEKLNDPEAYSVLIVTNEEGKLVGALTDGDIRRGILNGLTLADPIHKFIQENPKSWSSSKNDFTELYEWRDKNYNIIPYVKEDKTVIDVLNFRLKKSFIPADVVIMAGGKGTRLRPLTNNIPKPLLKVGSKSILEHNIDWLNQFGIRNYFISINYLKEQIKESLLDGSQKNINIKFIEEERPLGTIGALSKITEFENDYIIVMNSDILTNINFEKLFLHFLKEEVDMVVSTVPYEVKIPYGVLELKDGIITDIKEKPTYTYYSNGGIYMLKKEILSLIPKNEKYDAPELILDLCRQGKNVANFPILDYWLDIGKHEDFDRAQRDIQHIKF